eukprot:472246_1
MDTPDLNPDLISCFSFMSLVGSGAIIITIHSLYHLYCADSSSWINKTYRTLTMITMTLLTSGIVLDIIKLVIFYYGSNLTGILTTTFIIYNNLICGAISDVVYFFGNIAFYVLLLLRVTSPFQLKKSMVFFLLCMIFFFGLISIAYMASWILYFYIADIKHNDTTEIDREYHIAEVSASMILSVTDFILNVIIFTVFICKMQQTISNIDPSVSQQINKNMNLISNVIIKHFILFGMAILSNQLFFLNQVIYYFSSEEWDIPYVTRTFSMRALECFINVLVLWLILQINYNKYICLCRRCHLCVARCLYKRNIDESVVENPYIQLQHIDI